MEWVLYILASIGLTWFITKSMLMRWFREGVTKALPFMGNVLSCGQCVGFWAGCFVYLCIQMELNVIIFGLSISACGYVADLIINNK